MRSVTIRKKDSVHSGQRPLEHPQLVVVLERLSHPTRPRRQIARQVIGGHHHTGRPAVPRSDHRCGMQKIARASERFDRSCVGLSAKRLLRQPIGRRSAVAGGHFRRHNVNDWLDTWRPARTRFDAQTATIFTR
mgnify:CR=1 FL=1